MAVNKGFSLDFNGFLDLAEDISNKYGDFWLLYAAEQALEKTREYVNGEIAKIVLSGSAGQWHLFKGAHYSQGKAYDSFFKVADMVVETRGTEVTAYAGFDLKDAPEVLFIIYGTPHKAADKKLYNAVKVKGKVKKEVERIQANVFNIVLNGGTIR